MENDLTAFEKNLLRSINADNNTKYNYKDFMEWGTDEKKIRIKLQENEEVFEALGVYVTIKIK